MSRVVIPKGTRLYINGVFAATTNRSFSDDYLPQNTDFDPPLKTGIKRDFLTWFFENELIYKHP